MANKKTIFIILSIVFSLGYTGNNKAQNLFFLDYELEIVSINTFIDDINFDDPVFGSLSFRTEIINGTETYNLILFVDNILDIDINLEKVGFLEVLLPTSSNYKLPFYVNPSAHGSDIVQVEGNQSFVIEGEISEGDTLETKYFGYQDVLSITNDYPTILHLKNGGTVYYYPNYFIDLDSRLVLEGTLFSMAIFYFLTGYLISGLIHLKESSIDIGPENKSAPILNVLYQLMIIIVPLSLAVIIGFYYKKSRKALRKELNKSSGSRLRR